MVVDRETERLTIRQTDKVSYRGASLLKIVRGVLGSGQIKKILIEKEPSYIHFKFFIPRIFYSKPKVTLSSLNFLFRFSYKH